MPRKPAAVIAPVDPGPAELTPEQLAADGALTVLDAAAFLGVKTTKMYELLNAGHVRDFWIDGRRLIPRASLRALIARKLRGE